MEEYRLPEISTLPDPFLGSKNKRTIRARKRHFAKGPIPLNWAKRAMNLGGSSFHVGFVLWYYRGLKGSMTLKVSIQDLADHIGRSWLTAQRGLFALEREGLITIERHKGRKHLVTIQEIEDSVSSGEI